MLMTLQMVKDRLQIPASLTDQDPVLDALRAAVEQRVLELTGFLLAGGVQNEELTDVQVGVTRTLRWRPIDITQPVTLQGRSLASQTFHPLLVEVKDAEQGRILPLASELTPIWPPQGGLTPWFRWRQMTWPVVKVTYTVKPLSPVPASLRMAAIEWAAAMYRRASGLSGLSVSGLSEQYEDGMPLTVRSLLTPYIRDLATLHV